MRKPLPGASAREFEKYEAHKVAVRKWRLDNPEKAKAAHAKYHKDNAAKKYAATKAWRAKNRLAQRRIAWRQQGLPEPTRAEPDVCECCGIPQIKALALDHCHDTGAFRGWLCSSCNTGIGMLGDSAAGIAKAASYLANAAQWGSLCLESQKRS